MAMVFRADAGNADDSEEFTLGLERALMANRGFSIKEEEDKDRRLKTEIQKTLPGSASKRSTPQTDLQLQDPSSRIKISHGPSKRLQH